MGMFDTITFKDKLEVKKLGFPTTIDLTKLEFQTKDIDNCMRNFVVEKGILYCLEDERRDATDEEKAERLKKWETERKEQPFSLAKDIKRRGRSFVSLLRELNPILHRPYIQNVKVHFRNTFSKSPSISTWLKDMYVNGQVVVKTNKVRQMFHGNVECYTDYAGKGWIELLIRFDAGKMKKVEKATFTEHEEKE